VSNSSGKDSFFEARVVPSLFSFSIYDTETKVNRVVNSQVLKEALKRHTVCKQERTYKQVTMRAKYTTGKVVKDALRVKHFTHRKSYLQDTEIVRNENPTIFAWFVSQNKERQQQGLPPSDLSYSSASSSQPSKEVEVCTVRLVLDLID